MSIMWKTRHFLPIHRPIFHLSATSLYGGSLTRNDRIQLCEPPHKSMLISQSRNFSISTAITNIYTTISTSFPVSCCQQGLIHLHDITGLPWWASIMLSTVLLRTAITFPLAVYQHKMTARLELIALEMPAIVNQLKFEAKMYMDQHKLPEQQMKVIYNRSVKKQWDQLVVRENCHPMKTAIILWGQIPLWICQSFALRNLVNLYPNPLSVETQLIFMGLSVGGFGWIPNLTIPDASYILPVTLGLVNLMIIEIQTMSRTKSPGKVQKCFTWFFRGLSIMMVPIAASVPSCLALYWVTSSVAALTQNLLIISPKVKRWTGIPTNTPSHMENPYQHLAAKMVYRIHSARDRVEGLFASRR